MIIAKNLNQKCNLALDTETCKCGCRQFVIVMPVSTNLTKSVQRDSRVSWHSSNNKLDEDSDVLVTSAKELVSEIF